MLSIRTKIFMSLLSILNGSQYSVRAFRDAAPFVAVSRKLSKFQSERHMNLARPRYNMDRIPYVAHRLVSTRQFGISNDPITSIDKKAVSLMIPTPEDMEEVGAMFSAIVLDDHITTDGPSKLVSRGDVLLLDGDLGAGKTSFSRGFLRASTGDEDLRVTSPTYLLVNVYKILDGKLEIHHMDLYRLSGNPEDLQPLNLDHVYSNCVALVEWPQRLGAFFPSDRLDINIRIDSPAGAIDLQKDSDDVGDNKPRIMTLKPQGPIWEERIKTILDEGYLDDLLLE